jgi:multisubunit Na+/H+ antiporter MnhG subunit
MYDKDNFALAYAWEKYRVYANTSRKRKAELTAWRFRVIVLGIGGAVLGVLCQEAIRLGLHEVAWNRLPTVLGCLSALSLGLAAYFGKELVTPEQERQWIRSRSIAEALKSQVYMFLTGTTPYNTDDKGGRLSKEAEQLLESVRDLPHESISEQEKVKGLPSRIVTVQDYINERVDDQINGFYRPRSKEYARKIEKFKTIGLLLGVIAIVLGALGSTGWTAGWVAVISTVTASIAAYAYAGRYQYLIISYQATANRLELLRTRWEASGKTDKDFQERNQFILDCEEAISIENGAWMAELTKMRQQ